jgi:hypothetical protein
MIISKQSGNGCSTSALPTNISIWQLFDRLLLFIKPIVEYALGMHLGFASGWLMGLYAGHVYVNHFEPLYINDLSELSFWTSAPDMFARYGALAGSIIGILAILIINSYLLNQKIIKLFEKGITDPSQIARFLGCSSGKIERKIVKLAQKGRISR